MFDRLATLVVLSVTATSACTARADLLSAAKETLDLYIDAVRAGDVDAVYEVYHSDNEDFSFYLPGPLAIHSYVIVSQRMLNKADVDRQMASEPKPEPEVAVGDIELDVEQFEGATTRRYTYRFRLIDGHTRLIAHSAWDTASWQARKAVSSIRTPGTSTSQPPSNPN